MSVRVVAVLSSVVAAVAMTAPAPAAVQLGVGHSTSPAQPYLHNPDASDWLGSYLVNGQRLYGVQFAYLAPDAGELLSGPTPLLTKWGTALAADTTTGLAALLTLHADTTSADEAAALAHIVHTWTAAPQNPGQLDPSNDFRHIAYDAPFHLAKLPSGAKAAVTRLVDEASTLRGPWSVDLTPPTAAAVDAPGSYDVSVRGASGATVPGRDVTLTLTGAQFTDASATKTVTTDAAGAVTPVTIIPRSTQFTVATAVDSPPATLDALSWTASDVQDAIGAPTPMVVTDSDAFTATAAEPPPPPDVTVPMATPPTTTQPAAPGVPPSPPALPCAEGGVALNALARAKDGVHYSGAALTGLAGHEVELQVGGRTVATSTVGRDGRFGGVAPLPVGRPARYTALIGNRRSRTLALDRELVLTRAVLTGGRVTLAGRLAGRRSVRGATVQLLSRPDLCGAGRIAATARVGTNRRFSVSSAAAPAGVYRVVIRRHGRIVSTSFARSLG